MLKRIPMRTLKTYFWHVLPVFLVACLIVVVLTPVYSLTRRQAGETVSQSLNAQLEKEFSSFGQSIASLKSQLGELRYDTQTAQLALQTDKQLKQNNYLPLYHVRKLMKKLHPGGLSGMQVMLQFRNNSTLLTSELYCADKKSAYQMLFGYENISYEEWQRMLLEDMENNWAAAPVMFRDEFGNMHTDQWITLNSYYSPKLATTLVFSIFVPVEELLDKILPQTERNTSLCYITDSRGAVLYDSTNGCGEALAALDNAQMLELDRGKYLAFSETSDEMGMNVSIAVPERILYASVEPVTRMTYSIILLALGCAALYCAGYAYVYFRPIVNLMETLGCENNSSRGISEAVQGMVTSLNADRERLHQEYASVNAQAEAYALRRAAMGAMLTPTEEALLQGKTVFSGPYTLTLLEYVTDNQEVRSRFFASVRTLISPEWNSCQVVEDRQMLLILPETEQRKAPAAEELLIMLNRLAERQVYLAVSAVHSGIEQLAAAAQEAETALFRGKLSPVNEVCRYENSMAVQEPFAVPFQKYMDMTASLVNGDRHSTEELLAYFHQALMRSDLAIHDARRVLDNLHEAIVAAAIRLGAADGAEIPEQTLPLQRLEAMRIRALELCDIVTQQKGSRSDAQAQQILAFIQEHYTDSTFSLTTIADEFRLSEKYISRFIKKQTGLNYSTHIEQLRMEHARSLLVTTHMTVEEIALASGYEHKNTFYKAFKRYFDCVPNDLRSTSV